jgi:DNA polymerase alpha subunit A
MAYTPADAADSDSGRRTRTRGTEALGCTAVLEQLRAIRKGEIRASDASQVKIDEPIYDTIPEEEYNALVAHRHKEADEFIIDNDGLGYDDDGRRTGTRTRTRGTESSRRTASAPSAEVKSATPSR